MQQTKNTYTQTKVFGYQSLLILGIAFISQKDDMIINSEIATSNQHKGNNAIQSLLMNPKLFI